MKSIVSLPSFSLNLLTITVTMVLSSCGGSSSPTAGSGSSRLVAGVVTDGLMENAKVCLDFNGNLSCDTGEPSAVTGKDGRYALSTAEPIDGIHVIAEIGENSKDADDGGRTIKEAGKEPFNLATPASRPEVVSPLTTLVSQVIFSDPALKTDAVSLKEAEDRVKAGLGLKTTLLGNDYAKDADTQKVAQFIATALGDVSKVMKSAINDATKVDSDLGPALGMPQGRRSLQLEAVKTVSAIASSSLSDGKLPPGLTLDNLRAQNQSQISALVAGQLTNIIAGTKLPQASVGDAQATITRGVVISGSSGHSGGYRANGTYCNGCPRAEFIKYDPQSKQIKTVDRMLDRDSASTPYRWVSPQDPPRFSLILSSDKSNWVKVLDGWIQLESFDKNCAVGVQASEVPRTNVCFITRDLTGLKIRSFDSEFCNVDQKKAFPACNADATFLSGATLFDIQQSLTDDQYEIFVNDGNGYSTSNKGTIDGFITASKNLVGFIGAKCNTAFKVKSYDPLLKTGKFAWSHNSTVYCSSAPPFSFEEVDETSFEVKVLGGKGVIITEFSPVYKKNNTGEGVGGKLLFGEALGGQNGNTPGVYSGELRLRSVKAQQPSTRYQFYASPEFTNSFIKGYGIPDFPYADANK